MDIGWMDDAACVGYNPDLWFPVTPLMSSAQLAMRVCNGCQVQAECLRFSQEEGITHGIWGGRVAGARAPNRPARGSEEEEDLREAVKLAVGAGWTLRQTARNLRAPFQTVARLAREQEMERAVSGLPEDTGTMAHIARMVRQAL